MKSHIIGATSLAMYLSIAGQLGAAQQMRTDCITDPQSPGGCFFDVIGRGQVLCEEGVIELFTPEDTHSFHRINPDGTEYAHANTKNQTFGFCYWSAINDGSCFDGTGAFFGKIESFNANGVLRPEGYLGRFSCPWYGRAKGAAYRAFDQELIKIDLILDIVKDHDSPTGCTVRTCQIVAPR